MSVAFRRESDEEHREPRFELPVPPGLNLVTKRGYDLIKTRTEDLEAAVAAACSDEQRAELQRDLRYWRAPLATAQIASGATGDTVAFGIRVDIEQGGRVRVPPLLATMRPIQERVSSVLPLHLPRRLWGPNPARTSTRREVTR